MATSAWGAVKQKVVQGQGCKVEVSVRVRPYIEKYDADIEQNAENAIRLGSEPNSIVYGAKGFSFHRVFTSEVPTQTIFEDSYQHMVQSAVDGFNVTMFAYGQTGAGKTHTMAGTEEVP